MRRCSIPCVRPARSRRSAARNLLTVESQDRIFGGLIALSDMLEYVEDPALRAAAVKLLRRMRPLLDLCGREPDRVPERLEPVLGRLSASCAGHPSLAGIAGIFVERLRIGYRLKGEAEGRSAPDAAPSRRLALNDVLLPLRANLTWSSAILRHAVRAVVLTVVAITISLLWWSVYAHWLTITVALTMQPYFAATWQRALERIGGTVLGALLGGALAFLPQTTIVESLLMVPLCVIGFSVRQVSYGAYVACLTPLVVILFEVAEPGHSALTIALMRTLYTVGGGIVAVLACMVLWPSWEPDRTVQGLGEALRAHARYAKSHLSGPGGRRPSGRASRRRVGPAALPATISRRRCRVRFRSRGEGRGASWRSSSRPTPRCGGSAEPSWPCSTTPVVEPVCRMPIGPRGVARSLRRSSRSPRGRRGLAARCSASGDARRGSGA